LFFIYIVIIYFIKYKFEEFELNGMNVYVWYDVVSMFVFVNDVVCNRDYPYLDFYVVIGIINEDD